MEGNLKSIQILLEVGSYFLSAAAEPNNALVIWHPSCDTVGAMINPFKIKGLAQSEGFFNRHAEIDLLTRHALGGQHTLIIAPRRFGKSSLLAKVKGELEHQYDTPVASVDLFKASTIHEFIQLIGREILHTQKGSISKLLGSFKKGLPRVAPQITVDPMGEVDFTLKMESPQTSLSHLEDLLIWFDQQNPKKRKLLILDEIQEIVSIDNSGKIEKYLRAIIQRLEKTTVFFSGSLPSVLKEMFFKKNRAFYQSAIQMNLGFTDIQEAKNYLRRHLEITKIPEQTLDVLVEATQGHPYYLQVLGYFAWEIWLQKKQSWEGVTIDVILNAIFSQERINFENEISLLTSQQRQIFRAIAADPHQPISSSAFIQNHRLPGHSSVRKAVQKLEALGYVLKEGKGYRVADPILKLWWAKP